MKANIPLLFLTIVTSAVGQSNIDSSLHFAHAANTGWIDFKSNSENGVVVTANYLSGYAHGANFGWMSLGSSPPENDQSYANTSDTDYGVNVDASGNLSGHAYAANIGWVDFGWTEGNDPNRAAIDPSTGEFSGYAYSANIGWVLLGTGRLFGPLLSDTDSDGISDAWEKEHFGNTTTAGVGSDYDKDGQTDASESVSGSDPKDPTSFFQIVSQTYNTGHTEVTVTFTSASGREYRLEYTGGLNTGWTDSNLGIFSPDPGDSTTRTISIPTSTRQFIRVVTSEPL